MEAGQQSDDAGRCLPSTVVIRSGRCPGVKGGAFGGGFAEALAGQAEAMGVVDEAVEDGRTPLNPTIIDRTITHVTITDPQHSLFGKRLAVFRERSGRGPAFVVVELPDGRKRPIRISSTDLATTVITSGVAPNLRRISVRTLIPLVQHLSANLALLAEEVIRDGSSRPSASRCVSTSVNARRRIPPASDGASAPLAEPLRRDTNADRPNACGADEANTAAPRRARKGDRPC